MINFHRGHSVGKTHLEEEHKPAGSGTVVVWPLVRAIDDTAGPIPFSPGRTPNGLELQCCLQSDCRGCVTALRSVGRTVPPVSWSVVSLDSRLGWSPAALLQGFWDLGRPFGVPLWIKLCNKNPKPSTPLARNRHKATSQQPLLC